MLSSMRRKLIVDVTKLSKNNYLHERGRYSLYGTEEDSKGTNERNDKSKKIYKEKKETTTTRE